MYLSLSNEKLFWTFVYFYVFNEIQILWCECQIYFSYDLSKLLSLHDNPHLGDVILTACFLINRAWCTCFVHNVFLGLDKLSAKAIKYGFLEYSLL